MATPHYMVVTEHWPRNPSKPMWLHAESRILKSAVTASDWADFVRAINKKKKNRCLGKTFVVEVLDRANLDQKITDEIGDR